ncbi:hypothetical protein K438DRAFT_1784020 [Mycena galopus ATCC 62051]|nr:hypothetical protein K438DRAFT_1784020 [Mycena galopus ATCC 62051]
MAGLMSVRECAHGPPSRRENGKLRRATWGGSACSEWDRTQHGPALARPPQAASCRSMCGEEAGARGAISALGGERLARAVHNADSAFREESYSAFREESYSAFREESYSAAAWPANELRADKSDAVGEGGGGISRRSQKRRQTRTRGGCGMVEEEESGGGTDEREWGGAEVRVLLRCEGKVGRIERVGYAARAARAPATAAMASPAPTPREESDVLGERCGALLELAQQQALVRGVGRAGLDLQLRGAAEAEVLH